MTDQVLLVRHASAGNRERWSGDDRLRPLDERGRRQAHGLVAALGPFGVDRLSLHARRRRGASPGPAFLLDKGAARILETTGSGVVPGQHIVAPEA